MFLAGLLGYNKKVGFMVGLTAAQISEFSLILIALGLKVGHIQNYVSSLVTLVGLVTMAGSTYFVRYSDKFYNCVSKYLKIFERQEAVDEKVRKTKHDIILFGYNRIGYDLLESFKKIKKKFLVVDYNPEVIEKLTIKDIPCVYGDVDDSEFLDELNFEKIKMAVSTVPEFNSNLLLIRKIRSSYKKAIIIVISHNIEEAKLLYKEGATYVVLPHFLGGKYAAFMIEKEKLTIAGYLKEGKNHFKYLEERSRMGHQHPKIEKNK